MVFRRGRVAVGIAQHGAVRGDDGNAGGELPAQALGQGVRRFGNAFNGRNGGRRGYPGLLHQLDAQVVQAGGAHVEGQISAQRPHDHRD